MNGLLCCSGPAAYNNNGGGGGPTDPNMTLLEELQQQPGSGDWRPVPPAVPLDKTAADMLMDKTASLEKMSTGGGGAAAAASSSSWREDRTVEWVMESQRMMMVAACRAGGSGSAPRGPAPAYCGQDCGDGFCYNVWNSMVPV